MSDAGHPSKHGYVLCTKCKVWRPAAQTKGKKPVCKDKVWCQHEVARQQR